MFFKKDKNIEIDKNLTKITALLIHAAKIDENFSKKEESIIKEALMKMGVNKDNIEKIIENATTMEKDANQILDFTREVKNMDHENKIKIIETLWKIIYSNKEADIYETNLMRRLAGLLYIDNKTMGNIKDKIKNENI